MAELLDLNLISATSHSVARLYGTGVELITSGRPRLVSVAIQNLHATTEVRFWHGLIPVDPLDPAAGTLPEDPADWTGGQTTSAQTTLSTYGEKVKAGEYLEPFVTPNQQVYSYVASGTVTAHVKEGY